MNNHPHKLALVIDLQGFTIEESLGTAKRSIYTAPTLKLAYKVYEALITMDLDQLDGWLNLHDFPSWRGISPYQAKPIGYPILLEEITLEQ